MVKMVELRRRAGMAGLWKLWLDSGVSRLCLFWWGTESVLGDREMTAVALGRRKKVRVIGLASENGDSTHLSNTFTMFVYVEVNNLYFVYSKPSNRVDTSCCFADTRRAWLDVL